MILDQNSKSVLVECMRGMIHKVLTESTQLTSKEATDKSNYVYESASYEQLLNITLNPRRNERYLPDYVLEGAFAVIKAACETGRRNIGIFALTEGGMNLEKQGYCITDTMMDAALTAVQEGSALNLVKSYYLTEDIYRDMFDRYYGSFTPNTDDYNRAIAQQDYKDAMEALKSKNNWATLTPAQKTALDTANTERKKAEREWKDKKKQKWLGFQGALLGDTSKIHPDDMDYFGGVEGINRIKNGGAEDFLRSKYTSNADRAINDMIKERDKALTGNSSDADRKEWAKKIARLEAKKKRRLNGNRNPENYNGPDYSAGNMNIPTGMSTGTKVGLAAGGALAGYAAYKWWKSRQAAKNAETPYQPRQQQYPDAYTPN